MRKTSDEKKPLVSVVIPFFSKKRGVLKNSVASVIGQSYQNIEIIIVDDSSPVSANEDLKDIYDKRLTVIANETNRNGAYSRNRGISLARGMYIALLDSDDFWCQNHIEECVKNIGDADFSYSNVIEVLKNKKNKYREVCDINLYENNFICDALLESPPQTNSFFFKKECYPAVKFNERLNRHQDFQFFIDFCTSSFKTKKNDSYTSYYHGGGRGKAIDYMSIIDFWSMRKGLVTDKKLKKFFFSVSCAITKHKKDDLPELFLIRDRFFSDSLVYSKIIEVKSRKARKILFFLYYNIFLDCKNLPGKLCRYVSY